MRENDRSRNFNNAVFGAQLPLRSRNRFLSQRPGVLLRCRRVTRQQVQRHQSPGVFRPLGRPALLQYRQQFLVSGPRRRVAVAIQKFSHDGHRQRIVRRLFCRRQQQRSRRSGLPFFFHLAGARGDLLPRHHQSTTQETKC
jgi:hypothetical protein